MPILATGRSPEPESMHRQHAFTLLELVVVLALIGVILSFARLSLGDGGAAARLEQDARTLAAALRLAHDGQCWTGANSACAWPRMATTSCSCRARPGGP